MGGTDIFKIIPRYFGLIECGTFCHQTVRQPANRLIKSAPVVRHNVRCNRNRYKGDTQGPGVP